ncbi:MAG: FdhF/YdeP family oxidoreductase [Actinomycetota bacterium]|nr:FdhF/YdeP family oxidoreductase [Actinomycetota bacterium]
MSITPPQQPAAPDEPTDSGEDGTVTPPKRFAAGLPGVVAGGRAALTQMGATRSVRTLLKVNQTDGFDCPGCAWPESLHRSHVEFCENGAKAVAEEATRRRVGRDFFARHSVDDLRTRTEHWLGQQGRLTEPMVLRPGGSHYEPIEWSDAFELIADQLRSLDDPDEAVFYTSGRTSNEAAFLYQLLVRRFGTNNLPDCSNMCHESSGRALDQTIGIGKGSVTLDDVESADVIFVVGQNPGTNHPRMLTTLESAKRRGATIVTVNPLPEAGLLAFRNPQKVRGVVGSGTALSDHHLQVRINGDLALFSLLGKRLLEDDARRGDVLDHDFIAEHTDGFEQWAEHLGGLDAEELRSACGIGATQIEAVHRAVVGSDSVIICWAMGLTQHRNSVATIREVVNYLLARGNIGRPGAGVCPVRGHSNVQGDRTMGIFEHPPAWLPRLGEVFGFEPPRDVGFDTVASIEAMADGRAKVFIGMGGNFVSAAPDTAATAAALRRCELTVQVSTKLNRSHLDGGEVALILPARGRTDRGPEVSVEDSMGMVHLSRGTLEPPAPTVLSEVTIISRLARQLFGSEDPTPWEIYETDHDAVRDRIAEVVPGFDDFNTRVRVPGGFQLPHGPRDERRFDTPTGLARFTANPVETIDVPEGHLLLQTMRSHDQYNTTIYGMDDRYRGVHGARHVVFVHADDLSSAGLADGDLVDITSVHRGVERRAHGFRAIEYPTAPGCCAAYFPEANVLVPLDSYAEDSRTPTSKSIVVRLSPAADRRPARGA